MKYIMKAGCTWPVTLKPLFSPLSLTPDGTAASTFFGRYSLSCSMMSGRMSTETAFVWRYGVAIQAAARSGRLDKIGG
jgi:hypothetical protein